MLLEAFAAKLYETLTLCSRKGQQLNENRQRKF